MRDYRPPTSQQTTKSPYSQKMVREGGNYVGNLFVPIDIYYFLESKLCAFNIFQEVMFLDLYGEMYGQNSKRYLSHNIANYRNGTVRPSNNTWISMLEIVPRLLEAQERFMVFETIINANNQRQKHNCTSHKYEFTLAEWRSAKPKIEREITSAVHAYYANLDCQSMDELKAIKWFAEDDIMALRRILWAKRKKEEQQELQVIFGELGMLASKLFQAEINSHESYMSDFTYSHKTPADDFQIRFVMQRHRDNQVRQQKKEKLEGCLMQLFGALLVILVITGGCD